MSSIKARKVGASSTLLRRESVLTSRRAVLRLYRYKQLQTERNLKTLGFIKKSQMATALTENYIAVKLSSSLLHIFW